MQKYIYMFTFIYIRCNAVSFVRWYQASSELTHTYLQW